MAAVAQDEVVNADNPLIFFAFQSDGKLTDLFSLSRSIYAIALDGTPTLKISDAPLDLTDAPVGTHIGIGTYHADFAATGYTTGTYEIRWRYQLLSTDSISENRQRFEVLNKNKFYSGKLYVGYCSSIDLMADSPFDVQPLDKIHQLINTSSRRIEGLTNRFFEPRRHVTKINGRGIRGLELAEPIIGIEMMEIESGVTGLEISLTEIAIDGVRVFSRHLQGLTDPDDRDDPRIEIERFEGLIFQSLSTFPKGPQTIHVTGVFGYTNPDGGPMGITPPLLLRVIGSMSVRTLLDPFGQDRSITDPFSVTKAKTRDQEIGFSNYGNTISLAASGLTGDAFVDEILYSLTRPAHHGAV